VKPNYLVLIVHQRDIVSVTEQRAKDVLTLHVYGEILPGDQEVAQGAGGDGGFASHLSVKPVEKTQ